MSKEVQITFDCGDPGALCAFWCAALDYRLQPPPPGFDDWDTFLDLHPPGSSRVEFTLVALGDGTRLGLRHSGLPEERVPGHARGWAHFLPRLQLAAGGGDPGPDPWADRTSAGTMRANQLRFWFASLAYLWRFPADVLNNLPQGKAFSSVELAWQQARQRAAPQDIVLVCGSFHTVAQVMESIETEKGRGK